MKLITKNKFRFTLLVLLAFQIISIVNTFSAKKISEMNARRHKRHKSKKSPAPASTAPAGNSSNQTQKFSQNAYDQLNNTFTIMHMHLNEYKNPRKTWDFKILDKQLEDIYRDMLYTNERNVRPLGIRAFIQLFIGPFESCDTNGDNILSLTEFTGCMQNDTYFKMLSIPNVQPYLISSYVPNQNYTNATYFYNTLFNLLDNYQNNYLNFHDYMFLRLMVYSWKKCSVQSPFIEEVNFECAIEISSGYRTLSKIAARRLFQLGLELSNSQYQRTQFQRNLDFISFLYISSSMRLFAKINGKEDGDITKNEFNNALDNNILPIRYSQVTINEMFSLVKSDKILNRGVDKFTFVFLDFNLRLFSVKNATRPYYISSSDFQGILNNTIFPNTTLQEIFGIPSYLMTNASYQMFTSMNISQFYVEDDYLLKFLEVKSNKKKLFGSKAPSTATPALNSSLPPFNLSFTANMIFNLIDVDNDGWVPFKDFAHVMQLLYIFQKNDIFSKQKMTVGKIIEIFKSYSDYPRISMVNRERTKRLEILDPDLYINAWELIVMYKIDDIMKYYVRETDKASLNEVDLKNVLNKAGFKYIPDAYLNKCLRGNDRNNVPKYDWECSINTAITLMSMYYDSAVSYLTTKNKGLSLANTVFNNVDPQII